MILNYKKTFQSLGSEHSLRTDLEVSIHFLFYAKNISKTILKTILKTKEATYTLVFGKYLVVSVRSHSIRAFSVFLEDSLRIIA
jgi:hypothetical protein